MTIAAQISDVMSILELRGGEADWAEMDAGEVGRLDDG